MNNEIGYANGKFNGNWFQWFTYEMKQVWKSKAAIGIWLFGTGFQIANLLSHPITWISVMTSLATIVGLLCTVAMMVGSPINGFFGAISVIGFVIANAATAHWWSIIDQSIFFVCIDLPLTWNWKHWAGDFDKKVRSLNKKGIGIAIIAVLVFWAILYPIGVKLHDSLPFTDSLTLAIGAVASILCTLHYRNTYALWLAEDIINVILWMQQAIHFGINASTIAMLVSTLMYLVTAIYGQFISPQWKKGKQNKQAALKNKIA